MFPENLRSVARLNDTGLSHSSKSLRSTARMERKRVAQEVIKVACRWRGLFICWLSQTAMSLLGLNIEPKLVWHRVQYQQTGPSCKLILVFANMCYSLCSHIEIQDLRSRPKTKSCRMQWLPLFFVCGARQAPRCTNRLLFPQPRPCCLRQRRGSKRKILWSRRASQIRLSKIVHPLFLLLLIWCICGWLVYGSFHDRCKDVHVKRKDGKGIYSSCDCCSNHNERQQRLLSKPSHSTHDFGFWSNDCIEEAAQ